MTVTAPRKYECARCGRKRPAEAMVHSPFTRKRYCGVDFATCERRAQKRTTA